MSSAIFAVADAAVAAAGADRVIDNIEEMCGFRLKIHWWICWKFITPALLIVRSSPIFSS